MPDRVEPLSLGFLQSLPWVLQNFKASFPFWGQVPGVQA